MVENESPKEDNSKRLGKRNIERWIECVQYGMDVLRMKLVPGTVSIFLVRKKIGNAYYKMELRKKLDLT